MFTTKSTLASLQKRASAITDVFTRTKNDSLILAKDVQALSDQKQIEIANLQMEVISLNALAKGHENLAAKIDSFLNS